ncbi:LysM peptidoglycan-binding domain-containing protein [Dyella telluris]|uniref:Substrate-binding domain-containing protein n=1 Tax=Dyella telluris TaxID=2763498 RepID=A0A7G8Q7Y4_9GAMM|nr:substrate-binding domain-containing protein [Dyella telluris]QNK02892.1 substrate-binding domain-containing protein [Dyella telluris]
MSRRLSRLLIVALISSCAATGAFAAGKTTTKSTKKPATPPPPALVWRGDYATARGVVEDVAKAYEKSGKGRIDVQPFNTASGLDAVEHGLADIAGSARSSSNDTESTLLFTPVAFDALVMVTHPSNSVPNLTAKQLHDIYLGKITNWRDVGGKDAPIDLYAVASPGDGVEYSLRRLLFGRGNQPVAAPRLYVNTAKLEEAVTLDPNALGVTTLSGVANNAKVRMISIEGVAPSLATVSDGSYQLYTPLFLVTNKESPKAAQIAGFMQFLLTDEVKSLARAHHLVPYVEAHQLAQNDKARREKLLAEAGSKADVVDDPALTQPQLPVAPTAAAEAAPATAAAAEKSGSAAAGETYTVSKGDTLGGIAKKYSVTVAQLKEWNHLSSDNVKLDQVLKVSGN